MGVKDTYTITSDAGITLAIVPKDFMEQFEKNVYILFHDGDRPEASLVHTIECEAHVKLDSDEAVEEANLFYRNRGFISVSDYIVYRISEYIRDILPICRNCSCYMKDAGGYCHTVGASVQSTGSACPQFSFD